MAAHQRATIAQSVVVRVIGLAAGGLARLVGPGSRSAHLLNHSREQLLPLEGGLAAGSRLAVPE